MRKTKLTEERKAAIIDAIRRGNTKENAARMAGISSQTIYNWLARGREEEAPDLEGLSIKKLKTMAKEHSIKGYSRMNREQLEKAIIKAGTIYAAFLEEMEQAEALGLSEHVRNVTIAGVEDWRASAWFLERRDPDNWSKRERLQADINHSGGIKTEHEESYKIEVEQRLTQDPELQNLYMQIWERQQLANKAEE